MGATDFTTIAVGKTAQKAFQEAQEAARYNHGHAGYTGTIAEKSGYYLFELPPRLDPNKVLRWVPEWDYIGETDDRYLKEELERLKSYALTAKPGTKRAAQARVREYEKLIKENAKERAKLVREIGPNLSLVKDMAGIWGDKWGSAVGFEITSPTQKKKFLADWYARQVRRGEKVYVFFGMASC